MLRQHCWLLFFLACCSTVASWTTTCPRRMHGVIATNRNPAGYWHEKPHGWHQHNSLQQGRNSVQLQGWMESNDLSEDVVSVPLLLIVALGLGLAAQGFINQMLEGDQGLAAFLRDGSGYNKSGLKPSMFADKTQQVKDDPLPWLKLPQLDFVEVAGQETAAAETVVIEKLESVRAQMYRALEEGNMSQAESLKQELEEIMKANNIEYTEFE